ncbi:unnamed protein product, partial [Didymodactylos carnosus]
LDRNYLTNELFAELLRRMPNLTSLSLSYNNIEKLFYSLDQPNNKIQYLKFDDLITQKTFSKIQQLLPNLKMLGCVIINDTILKKMLPLLLFNTKLVCFLLNIRILYDKRALRLWIKDKMKNLQNFNIDGQNFHGWI